MQPTSSTTLQRPDLGAIAYEYSLTALQRGLIADAIFPLFPVTEKSADYPVIPNEAMLKIPDLRRSPKGGYNRDDFEFETDTYSCKEYGKESPVDDVERKLYSRYFDAEEVATLRATNMLLRAREKRVSSQVFNATTFASYTGAVSTEWDTSATCTPRADVQDAIVSIRNATGAMANTAIMAWSVFQNVLISADFKSHVQYTTPVLTLPLDVQKRLVAQYMNIDNILVGNSVYDSANEGQSQSISDIWDDEYCMVAQLATNGRDLREPCLGRTFLWTEDSPDILVTEQYREEATRGDIYRVRHHLDEEFVFLGAGYLLSNITT